VKRPLLLGHRGCRGHEFGENSQAAFDYALTQGCDGFEFDVRHTRDRRNVIWHDPICCGKEIASTKYPDLARGRDRLACLEDVLARFGHSAYLDIELKVGGNEERVLAALRAMPPSRGYVVSSFFPEVLLRLNQLDPSVPLGFICDRPHYVNLWTELAMAAFIPHHRLVSKKLIDAAHRRGVKLFTWTVNQRRELLRFASWGVDGLISDDPRLLSRTFAKSQ